MRRRYARPRLSGRENSILERPPGTMSDMPRLFLAALVVLAACEHGQTPIETAIVAPLRKPCQGFVQQLCLTMVPDQQPTETLFFGIEGYTHRWGVESEISLRREALDPPPADGPSENLILLEIIAENETITGPFQLEFPFGPGWFQVSGSGLDMHGTSVQCDSVLRDQILTADSNGFSYTVTMQLTDDPNTLLATAVQ